MIRKIKLTPSGTASVHPLVLVLCLLGVSLISVLFALLQGNLDMDAVQVWQALWIQMQPQTSLDLSAGMVSKWSYTSGFCLICVCPEF